MTDSPLRPLALDLLDRYLANECTSAEVHAVELWLASDRLNRDVLRGMRELRVVQGALSPEQIDSAWKEFAGTRLRTAPVKKTSAIRSTPRRGMRWGWMGAAAAIALIAGASGGFFATRLQAPKSVASGSAMRSFSTIKGQRATIQLVDGSRVTLGPESRIDVASEFSSGVRNIHVTGAAFFEVTHDPASPFVVHSGNAMVQAIGTAFSVVRYPRDTSMQVVVSQGKVAVRGDSANPSAPGTTNAVLAQGDAVEFVSPEHVMVRRDVDVKRELAWISGELTFRRMPLSDVVRVIERWYDVSIVITDPALASQRVTATFGREGITEIVSQLTNALGARYRYQGRTFFLVPSS